MSKILIHSDRSIQWVKTWFPAEEWAFQVVFIWKGSNPRRSWSLFQVPSRVPGRYGLGGSKLNQGDWTVEVVTIVAWILMYISGTSLTSPTCCKGCILLSEIHPKVALVFQCFCLKHWLQRRLKLTAPSTTLRCEPWLCGFCWPSFPSLLWQRLRRTATCSCFPHFNHRFPGGITLCLASLKNRGCHAPLLRGPYIF